MSVMRPKFVDSPYFVPEEDNWHLKDGAPGDIKAEFEQFMSEYKKHEEEGKNI